MNILNFKKLAITAFITLLGFGLSLESTSNSVNFSAEEIGDLSSNVPSVDDIGNIISRTQPIFTYSGNVKYWNNPAEKELALYIKDNGTAHYIVLQQTNYKSSLTDGNYKVELFNTGLLLKNNTSNKFYFIAIDDNEAKELLNDIYKRGQKVEGVDLSAKGIIHHYSPVDDLDAIDAVKLKNRSVLSYFKLNAECNHGGPGASSCSFGKFSGGSVSCKAGTYACCVENKSTLPSSKAITASCSCKDDRK